VIYEDNSLPELIRRERLEDIVVLATTRAALAFAEERGLINSAEDIWNEIIKKAPGANPIMSTQVIRPM